MGNYRLSRNIEQSLVDYFRKELTDDAWVGITVVKGMKREQVNTPKIVISVVDMDVTKKEIGSGKFLKFSTVYIRLYAKDEGQREDLSDWMIEKLEDEIEYYEYQTVSTVPDEGVALTGTISILKVLRNEREFMNTDPALLEHEDLHRHLISFSCYVGITDTH